MTNGLASTTLATDPNQRIDSTTVFPGESPFTGENDVSIGPAVNQDSNGTVPELNCTPPAIDDFPRDLFTQEQRRQGYLVVHFLAAVYIFYSLALVCDEYFVPCIECICDGKISPN